MSRGVLQGAADPCADTSYKVLQMPVLYSPRSRCVLLGSLESRSRGYTALVKFTTAGDAIMGDWRPLRPAGIPSATSRCGSSPLACVLAQRLWNSLCSCPLLMG